MKIAIITGASSGIGREFVRQLETSEKFDEIWLIARREDRLKLLAEEISTPARILPLDLSKEASWEEFSALLAEIQPEISVLVNASGYGKFRAVAEMSLADQLGMIDLNQKALVAVTHHALPYLATGARVYQMASISAFQPVPYIGVYAATKAFVLSYARALNVELRRRGIHVLAICPFWVKTEFFDRAVSDDTVKKYTRYLTSERVVRTALRDMKRGKDVSVCGFRNRLQVLAVKLLPHTLIMKIWCNQQSL